MQFIHQASVASFSGSPLNGRRALGGERLGCGCGKDNLASRLHESRLPAGTNLTRAYWDSKPATITPAL